MAASEPARAGSFSQTPDFLPPSFSIRLRSKSLTYPKIVAMAEAIAAVALAGNVLQFFDVAGKFTLKAAEIYRSKGNQDGPSNLRRLSRISTDLQALFEKLQTPLSDSPALEVPQLSSLSTECSHLIEEVLQKLEKIGVGNRERRMDLILSEFKATWQRAEIQGLENRIIRLREQLATHLVVVLRYV